MNRVFLSLGSNKGDSFRNIKTCIQLISKMNKTQIINKSNIYITKPMYNENQKKFLNMVIEINTMLKPQTLLSSLQKIELKLGRIKNRFKNQPREIDVDILDYNNKIINQESLILPHPLIKERVFVLKPWTDISPTFKLPASEDDISQMMSRLDKDEIKIFINKE